MSKALTSLIFLVTTLLSSNVMAVLTENISTDYYSISPRTAYDIKRELNWRSPIREHGTTFHGRTNWSISWQFSSRQSQYGCIITRASTNVGIKYILPIMDTRITNPNITGRFDKFNQALTQHEHNHGANGLKAAKEIDDAISTIPPQQNCRQLERMANGVGRGIIKKYTAIDNEYDRRTQNGRTEGAHIE